MNKQPKRNKAQNKMVKSMLNQLDSIFGPQDAGMIICMLSDAINKLLNEKTPGKSINLRTIEITFNDFYSVKYDYAKGEYV